MNCSSMAKELVKEKVGQLIVVKSEGITRMCGLHLCLGFYSVSTGGVIRQMLLHLWKVQTILECGI